MPVEITCRGCGNKVSRNAAVCFICRCPHPTCHLTDDLPEAEPLDVLPATPSHLGLAVAAGVGVTATLLSIVSVAALFLAVPAIWRYSAIMPPVKTLITSPPRFGR